MKQEDVFFKWRRDTHILSVTHWTLKLITIIVIYCKNIMQNQLIKQTLTKRIAREKKITVFLGTSGTGLLSLIKLLFNFNSHTSNCTEEELKHIGFKAVRCILKDYRQGKTPRVLLTRLWRIVKIWTLVYLCIAVPLWCTRGWCCCCLFCKFFKPQQTIKKAKKYLLANPPGTLKRSKGEEIRYEATENERDAYEVFEHLIRTI